MTFNDYLLTSLYMMTSLYDVKKGSYVNYPTVAIRWSPSVTKVSGRM